MDFSAKQKASKRAKHSVKIHGAIDVDDGNPLYYFNQYLVSTFQVSLKDIAENRTLALSGKANRFIWTWNADTISKRMHDWAFKAGFNWGEISSHSNRRGKLNLYLILISNMV